MSNYTIRKSFHDKKKIDIWLVKLVSQVDYSQFKQFERLVKQAGGYYSNFVRAFVFEKEPSEQLLSEIFGGATTLSETAQSAGVPQNKVAKIRLGDKYQKIRRDVLKNEINEGKMMGARTSYFDGMQDMSVNIPEKDIVWENAKNLSGILETIDRGYQTPYASGNKIVLGDYELKYNDDIVIPEAPKVIRQRSSNFYVIIDDVESGEDKDKLDKIDSDNKDLEIGTKIISVMYGKFICGTIIDKKINTYYITKYQFGSSERKQEEQVSVNYKVRYDNGVLSDYSTFKVATPEECSQINVPDAILSENDYVFPQAFWTKNIIDTIKYINNMKEQKAGRKKKEYAENDQKYIDKKTVQFRESASKWLSWEIKHPQISLEITGETSEEQTARIEKWKSEFNIQPTPYSLEQGAKTEKEVELEKKLERQALIDKIKDHVAYKGYKFPTKMLQDIYLTLALRKLYDKYDVSKLYSSVQKISLNLAGKSNEKARQMQINQITGELVSPSNAAISNVEKIWVDWLKTNTDIFNDEIILEKPVQIEEKPIIVEEKVEEKILSLSPEDKKANIEKRIKGLEIANKINPNTAIEKRIKGLKISLQVI